MKGFLESSRYIVLLGIFGTFLAALALFLFGFFGIISAVWDALTIADPFSYKHLKELSIILIQEIDVFLLATVLYIITLGLYELFIDEALDLPHWLEVRTLDDLKARQLGVIIVLLPVTFLGQLVQWKQGQDILWLGLAVGIVLLAIAATQYVTVLRHKNK
jgi:uncharacterized membrane protein YqhA